MPLIPNFEMAQAFLNALDLDGQFVFVTIEEPKPAIGKPRIRELKGTLQHHAEVLGAENNLGAGVFAMVNQGSGRATAHVTRARAYFVDLDGAPIDPLLSCEVPPDLVIESSPGRYHAYWFTGDCPLHEFKPRQQALARRFNGDTTVCDLPRLMRLPGFYHRKSPEPFLSKIIPSTQPA